MVRFSLCSTTKKQGHASAVPTSCGLCGGLGRLPVATPARQGRNAMVIAKGVQPKVLCKQRQQNTVDTEKFENEGTQ